MGLGQMLAQYVDSTPSCTRMLATLQRAGWTEADVAVLLEEVSRPEALQHVRTVQETRASERARAEARAAAEAADQAERFAAWQAAQAAAQPSRPREEEPLATTPNVSPAAESAPPAPSSDPAA